MQTLIDAEVISFDSDGKYINDGVTGVYLLNEIYKKLGINGSFDLSPCDGEYGPQMCESRDNAIAVCQRDPTCDDVALASVPFAALEGSILLNTELAAMLSCISQLGYESLSTLTLIDWNNSINTCNSLIDAGNQGLEGFVNITQEILNLQGLIQASIGFDHPILNLGNQVSLLENEQLLSGYSPSLFSIAENMTSQNGYFDLYVADISIQLFLTGGPALVDADFGNLCSDPYAYNFKRESATAYVFAKYSDYIDDDIIGYFEFRDDIDNTDALFGLTAAKAITPKTFEQLYAVQDSILEVVSNRDELDYEINKFVFNFFL